MTDKVKAMILQELEENLTNEGKVLRIERIVDDAVCDALIKAATIGDYLDAFDLEIVNKKTKG